MRSVARITVVFLLWAGLGCELDPYPLVLIDGGGGATTDAEPDGCVPGAPEQCNEEDDNCNGRIDEGFDLSSDPHHCGACGALCDLPHAMAACLGGSCVITRCLPGATDADGEADNGCEGSCAVEATVTSEHCDGPDCCDGADNDCDGVEGEDHDTSADPRNCGGCSSSCTATPCPHLCQAPFAETRCEAGACEITACQPGHHDVDGDAANGCEHACTPTGVEDATVQCNGVDDDCDGEVDEEFLGQGLPCGPATAPCEQGVNECVEGRLRCVGGVRPAPEECNGIDDDCDGETDEDAAGVGGPCGDDPDGCVRGTRECTSGSPSCNDGVSPIGAACGTEEGACEAGAWACEGGEIVCSGAVEPSAEVCGDGIDNDCDGDLDDADGDLDEGARCDEGTGVGGVGICTWGERRCVEGAVACVGFAPPADEVCNGVDDDCNGVVDDGIALGDRCGRAEGDLTLWGHQHCLSGGLVCVGYVPARAELCDGQDNDDDGTFDEDATCPGEGATCIDGRCVLSCNPGADSLECPAGMTCTRDGCVGSLCEDAGCDDCQRCDPSTGGCVDACEGLSCPEGLLCHCGRCWPPTCSVLGCPEGQVCRQGRCQEDPCVAAGCGASQGCVDGVCFETCEPDECGAARFCDRGECVDDPCAGLTCPVGHCDRRSGECSTACVGVACLPGMSCDLASGRCADDACLRVTCPEGTTCEEGSCFEPLPPIPDAGPDGGVDAGPDGGATTRILWVLATGGGGSACSAAGAGSVVPVAGLLLLLSLGLFAGRRPRR